MTGTVPHSGPKKPEGAGLGYSLLPLPQPSTELQEDRQGEGSIRNALQSW